MDTLAQVVADEPVPPRGWQPQGAARPGNDLPEVPAERAGKRYGSAGELADDLRRCRTGEPIAARPVGRLERAAKWARRRPALAAVYVLVPAVLLLGGGGGGALWLWQRAEGERSRAEGERLRAEGERSATAAESGAGSGG